MPSSSTTIPSSNAPHQRVRLFDTLRGFAVVSMVLFHLYYDLVFIMGIIPTSMFFTLAVDIWRATISWTFLVIAGIMCTFSRNNLKRSLVYGAAAAAIFLVTSLIDKSVEISFGIIYCMAVCTLVVFLLSQIGFEPRGYAWAAVFFIAFLMLLRFSQGTITFFGIEIARIPRAIYESGQLSWLGLPGADFMSADYYPPIPYLFLYLAGWSLGLTWSAAGYTQRFWGFSIGPLEFIGRHALPIYVLHQPILLGVSQLLLIAIGR